jgi:hypothetical protein
MIAADQLSVFSPSSFEERLIEAVLPLIDESGTGLREGKTELDVVRALQPIFGHFTVYDAVMVHFMLAPAGETDGETPDGKDNPRTHAVFLARMAIVDFVGNARASSARCAEARAYLAEHEGDMAETTSGAVFRTIAADVKYVSRGRYRGQRFGDIDAQMDHWLPWEMVNKARQVANAAADGGDHDAA